MRLRDSYDSLTTKWVNNKLTTKCTNEKLQQIPSWTALIFGLTSHSTCPLCRLTLIPSHSHQTQEEDLPVPNLRTPSQPETHPEDHGYDGQCNPNATD